MGEIALGRTYCFLVEVSSNAVTRSGECLVDGDVDGRDLGTIHTRKV